jgi:stage II sporulation protein D
MTKLTVPSWLKQHPWVMLPLLGLIPLSTLAFKPELANPPSSPGVAVSPSVTMTPTPRATVSAAPSPVGSPSPKPSPKPSAQPNPKQSGPLPELTAEQKALNQKAKAQFAAQTFSVDGVIDMHVAIGQGSTLSLNTSKGAVLLDQTGHPLSQLSSGQAYTFQASGQAISVAGKTFPAIMMVEPTAGGIFYLNDRAYRGRLMLVSNGSQLLAVNYVNMRNYLYSVVASEVSPSWPPAALKAQAIAARSYALTYYFKPVSPLYHLGSDEYYQVYSGIVREAPETSQAVDATAGEFVSYRGGIVESLYAASDDIVIEAFQGKGMSQLGALGLAKQGYSYEQILGYYYPKTAVGRIELDHE